MNQAEETISFLDYVGVILKRRKLIFSLAGLVAFSVFLTQFSALPTYVAETKAWSSDPDISVEFIKSNEVLDGTIQTLKLVDVEEQDLRPARIKLLNSITVIVEKSVITLAVKNKDGELAAKIANTLVQGLKSKHNVFAEALLVHDKNLLEEQVQFFLAKQKQGLYLANIPISVASKSIPSVYIINEATSPLLGSRTFEIFKYTVFAFLVGFFFALLLVFALEYFERYKGNWEAMKRKYS